MQNFSNFLNLVACMAIQEHYWGLDTAAVVAEREGNRALANHFDDRAEHWHRLYKKYANKYAGRDLSKMYD